MNGGGANGTTVLYHMAKNGWQEVDRGEKQ